MTFRHFSIFIAVCEKNSMSRAAEDLFISQSAVSQVIKELETHYDVRLFQRISHKLYLTEDGKKLYDYAKHIVIYNDYIEESMMKKTAHQHLRVGSVSGYVLIDLAHAFASHDPDVDFSFFQGVDEQLILMLRSSALDLAITDRIYNPDEFESIQFDRSPMTFICNRNTRFPFLSEEHPVITLKQLSQLPLIIWHNNTTATDTMEYEFHKHGLTYHIKGRFLIFDSVQHAVFLDEGIGLISRTNINPQNQFFKEVTVEGLELYYDQYFVYHSHSGYNSLIPRFIEYSKGQIAQLKANCLDIEKKIYN